MKIRIVKCSNKDLWYFNQIGRELNVQVKENIFYIVNDDSYWRSVYKEDAEVVEDEKSCDNCNLKGTMECKISGCEGGYWQPIEPTIYKTETVEKSCDNCGFSMYNNHGINCIEKCDDNCSAWKPVKPSMRETADPSKIVRGSEQRKEEYRTCTNCLYGVDKPKDKCNICHPVNKTNWHEQDEIVTNDNGGRQSKNEWIKQGDGTTDDAKHYMTGKQQPIETMQQQMRASEFIGFLRGNVIKYILRMGKKDSYKQDAEKAMQYSEWLVQALNGETIIPGGK